MFTPEGAFHPTSVTGLVPYASFVSVNRYGLRPIAAFDGFAYGPRLPLALIPVDNPPSAAAIWGAMQVAEERAAEGDVAARLDVAVWWLTISAINIQFGSCESALEDFMEAHRQFVFHAREGGPDSSWKTVRHAAAQFNQALAYWMNGQHDDVRFPIESATRQLEGVPNADWDESYFTVKVAIAALELSLS